MTALRNRGLLGRQDVARIERTLEGSAPPIGDPVEFFRELGLHVLAHEGQLSIAPRGGRGFTVEVEGDVWRITPAGALFRCLWVDTQQAAGRAALPLLLAPGGLLWKGDRPLLRDLVLRGARRAVTLLSAALEAETDLAPQEAAQEAHALTARLLGDLLWRARTGETPTAEPLRLCRAIDLGRPPLARALAAATEALTRTPDDVAIDLALLDPEVLGEVHEDLLGRTTRQRLEASRGAGRRRRNQGSYYTPPALARSLATLVLDPLLEDGLPGRLRVLDPAMGSGQVLAAVLRRLTVAALRRSKLPLDLTAVRRRLCACLAGADLDVTALEIARLRLRLMAHAPGLPPVDLPGLVHGDALLEVVAADAPADLAALDAEVQRIHGAKTRAVHWRARFPRVFARGGFDAVVGNPPYHRELDGRELFTAVRKSRLGVHARSKGDLWFFFTHLALDLLRPGGQHAFVVPAYWLKATGAGSLELRERLRRETRWRALLDLERIDVFGAAVAARHVVFCVERRAQGATPDPRPVTLLRARPGATLEAVERAIVGDAQQANVERIEVDPGSVYGRRAAVLIGLALGSRDRALLERLQGGALPEGWQVSEGVTANPEHLTARAMERVKHERGVDLRARGLDPGAPVFVVPSEWPRAQALSLRERDHLVAYLRPCAIGRLRARPSATTPWLIYTTHQNARDPAEIPTLTAHLERAREVMEQRRETRRGSRAWYHLHWPRRDALLQGPRVLVPRMTRWPSASLTRERCATGESVYTVVPSEPGWSPLVTALLNSLPFALGILLTTKARGKGVDIPRAALAGCPWPTRSTFEEAARAGDRQSQVDRWLDAAARGERSWDTDLPPLALANAAGARLAERHAPETSAFEGPWWTHRDPRVANLGQALDEGVCRLLDLPYARLRALAEGALSG